MVKVDQEMDLNALDSGYGHRQVSAYYPSRAVRLATPRKAAALKGLLFFFFIASRALHPMIIDMSKVNGKMLYAKNSPVVMKAVVTIVLMNTVSFLGGGTRGVRQCWQPRCLAVFGLIGSVYALGDFLEMLSMSKLSGGVYQVLLQTKLLTTALLCWWLKGSGQTSLQWHVLLLMFVATSCFVIVDEGSSASGSASGGVPLVAMMCVLLKVAVSCYCAVLSEKYLKVFSDMPLPAKISGLATTWAMMSFVFCRFEPEVRKNGFFANWDSMTWVVTASFAIKTISTMYLLQALDSVQKNIGEALAVIVIYSGQVLLPSVDKAFDLSVFLLAILVVGLVKTYLVAPVVPKKKILTSRPRPSDRKLVSLHEGSKHLQDMGVDSLLCEVADVLPAGVFYGMLGGMYPVCGTTSASNPHNCELTFLAHPPWSPQVSQDAFGATADIASCMPSQSLTVLGHVRDADPGELMDADRCKQDVEKARVHLAEVFSEGISGP